MTTQSPSFMCSGEATRKSGSEATLNDRGSGTAVAYDSLKKSGQEARALATTEREVASVVLSRLLRWIATDGMDALADLPSDPLDWPSR